MQRKGAIVLARVSATLMLLASVDAFSQTSQDYALMGANAWAAFQCSTLVDKTERPDERQALFDFGYQQGKVFLQAMENGRIDGADVSRHVPIYVLDRLQPFVSPKLPTAEFRLGAIWESAARSILDSVESSAIPVLFALSEVNQRNCNSVLASAMRERR